MTAQLDFWFDFSCPYAYLASTKVEAVAARTGAILRPKPMLLGGVFRARNTPQKLFAVLSDAKRQHNAADLERTARLWDVPYAMPGGHPFRTVEALRAMLVLGEPYMPLAHAFYRAYWVDGLDLGNSEVLAKILSEQGHDATAVLQACQKQEAKDDLRRRTDEAIELGVFGAPACVVNGEIYWGGDRFDLVESALGGSPEVFTVGTADFVHPVDVWFDYSSPFAYLGVLRAHKVFGNHARYRPMLLGGLFKSIGTSNVPFFEQNEAKQIHTQADLHRQAEKSGLDFSWPTNFPINTVKSLRATIAAEELADGPADSRLTSLREGFMTAYWADQRDISQLEVVGEIVAAAGFDAERVMARIAEPRIKDALRAATEEAGEAGVFGAPSFVVRPAEAPAALYWGSDRIEFAARAATGDERLR